MLVISVIRFLVTKLHGFVHNDKWGAPIIEVAALVFAVFLGIAIHRHYVPHITEVQTNTVTKTEYVDKPVVSTQTVTKVIADPKDRETINKLLADNAQLQGQIVQLTNTVADLKSHGGTNDGGTITAPAPDDTSKTFEFKDWQLDAKYNATAFDYNLSQKFQIVTTTGKDRDGKRTELVNLFQQGPKGERIAVPAQTTAIIADNLSNHWFVRLNVQGGVNVSPNAPGGIVGMQWLKKGTTHAPEDQRWAALTPVMFFSKTVQEPGLLPFSFNIGNVKHQPFTNIWVSPYVGINVTTGISRFGIALSSTF